MRPIFRTVEEAKIALASDKLGTIYFKSDGVFVATAHGTGTFTLKEWRDGDGYDPSVGPQ